MTPTVISMRTAPSASFRFLPGEGFEVAIGRSTGSGNGAVASADAHWPRDLRRTVRAGLEYWRQPTLTETAELLVSELVTNAFRHGQDDVLVRVRFTARCLRIEVRDGSPEMPVLGSASDLDEGGRGLFLVKAFADTWGVHPDGFTTWCVLALPEPPGGQMPPAETHTPGSPVSRDTGLDAAQQHPTFRADAP